MVPEYFKAVTMEKCRKQQELEERTGKIQIFSPVLIETSNDNSEFIVVKTWYIDISESKNIPEISKKDLPYGDQYESDQYMKDHGGIKSYRMT